MVTDQPHLVLRSVSWEAIKLQRHRSVGVLSGFLLLDFGARDHQGQWKEKPRLAYV